MSKRIILFGPLPPPYGGVAIYMQGLAARLGGPKVRIWTYGGAKPKNNQIRFISHRKLGTMWALLAEGRQARILDASHFHLEYPNPLLVPIWIGCKRLLGFEWYKNILDGSLPRRHAEFGFLQRCLFQRAVRAVDEFIVVSEDLRRWLVEVIKVQQPVTVIPCLLPPLPGDRAAKLSNKTTADLQPFFARDQHVCSIGVFSPDYGFNDVAAAVEELRQRTGKDIGLLLLDGGFICDEIYRGEVLWQRDWITVLKEIPNPEIHEILKRSDVFVRAVVDEGFGISRIEALWSGTPVVATRVGETRGMLLYDFGVVEQLVNQLQAVLLYPVWEEPNPWAAEFRREAEKNLHAVAKVLGIGQG